MMLDPRLNEVALFNDFESRYVQSIEAWGNCNCGTLRGVDHGAIRLGKGAYISKLLRQALCSPVAPVKPNACLASGSDPGR